MHSALRIGARVEPTVSRHVLVYHVLPFALVSVREGGKKITVFQGRNRHAVDDCNGIRKSVHVDDVLLPQVIYHLQQSPFVAAPGTARYAVHRKQNFPRHQTGKPTQSGPWTHGASPLGGR